MTEGTKYHPLFEHLLFSGQQRLSMSFAEIEDVIGGPLPPSARKREEWWANSPSGHSQARAWLRASYRTSRINLEAQTVEFALEGGDDRYVPAGLAAGGEVGSAGLGESSQAAYEDRPPGSRPADKLRHPLFGIWKGKVKLVPGHDYTKPAFDPDDQS